MFREANEYHNLLGPCGAPEFDTHLVARQGSNVNCLIPEVVYVRLSTILRENYPTFNQEDEQVGAKLRQI